jgi:hypothetical protein
MYIVALRHNAGVVNETATTYYNCCVALGIGRPFALLRRFTVASVMEILRTVDSLLWLLCDFSNYSLGFTASQLYTFWLIILILVLQEVLLRKYGQASYERTKRTDHHG